jgi:hypothetical protein
VNGVTFNGSCATKQPSFAPDVLVIAEEFGDWEDSRRRIDLLAIDNRRTSWSWS